MTDAGDKSPRAAGLLRETLAGAVVGEVEHLSEAVDKALLRDGMQTWFQREMGKSRREEE